MAAIEVVLNNVDIENEEVREDFDYAFSKISDTFKGWLNSHKTLNETILRTAGTSNLEYVKKQIAHLVSNHSITINGIREILKESVGQNNSSIANLMESRGFKILEAKPEQSGTLTDLFNNNENSGGNYDEEIFGDDLCNSTKCHKILYKGFNIDSAVTAMDNLINVKPNGLFLGSLISEILPHLEKPSLMSFNLDELKDSTNTKCAKLDAFENELHGIFTELSKSFGFNENETVSIFDIPSMMAFVKYSDLWHISRYSQAFFHTRCQIYPNTHLEEDTKSCLAAWNGYRSNGS